MDSAGYLAGALASLAVLAGIGGGALALRRRLLPGAAGSIARLAELVLGSTLLVLLLQLLGTAGLLHGWEIVAGALLIGACGWAFELRPGRSSPAEPAPQREPASRARRVAYWLAAALAALLIFDAAMGSLRGLDGGIFSGDSTWYHLPFAARFAQDASITALQVTDPLRLTVWFYPASSELLHGAGVVLFDGDLLSPLANMFWLAVALLAAWCAGSRAGPVAALVSVALVGAVLGSQVMMETQAGEARNDLMGAALLLCSAAFLLRARDGGIDSRTRDQGLGAGAGMLAMAGLAAGLAVSVKLTLLVPVGVLAAGVLLLWEPRARRRVAFVFGLPLAIAGAYWFARNLIASGNPLPWVGDLGPISLPHPDQLPLDPRPRFSVFHYLADTDVIGDWFVPDLDRALGPLWPLVLALGIGGALAAVARGRDIAVRLLGAAVLAGLVAYVLTPLTAAGPEGSPVGFYTNLRYLMPTLALGALLLPQVPALAERRDWLVGVGVAAGVAYLAGLLLDAQWAGERLPGALLITALCLLPLGLALGWRAGLLTPLGAGTLAACGVVATVALGATAADTYERDRYSNPQLFLEGGGPPAVYQWGLETSDARIGFAGGGDLYFAQYAFYGRDLSNEVRYVGQRGPHGASRPPESCAQWRELINEGDYDYIVASERAEAGVTPVIQWLLRDDAADVILRDETERGSSAVFEVSGRLDPSTC